VSFDWRELDFFRARYGLSKRTDQLEAEICYDYELVRECKPLIDYILSFPNRAERARSYLQRLPDYARWAPNLETGVCSEHPEHEPIIPLACLLASWFPAPWLSGQKTERQRIVSQLARSYAHNRPLPLHPYSEEYRKMLELSVWLDRKEGRPYTIFLVALAEDEPFETTTARLIAARKALGHKPRPASKHHRYTRGAAAALHRLSCYRLAKLPPENRDPLIAELDFLRMKNVDSNISQKRKKVLIDLRIRNYFSLL
jgi:hypothetical protein